ncbi:enoyl-CoA hydratase/isomerase family protein [Nocardioides sp. MH1]|uniref:enoyl-CoA hydratase/isomerase family protein n=1 Tax=Nocardioides sp. MH1 TaxID=3242490 RepID=UPI0035209651
MTEQYVDYAFADGAARITLAAADRGNPIEPVATAQLHDAVLRAKADGARVIVLAADGRFFSVGGDLGAFAGAADPSALLLDLAESVHRVITELVRGDAVVVTVVQGTAAGGGFPLAAAGDIVLAAETAKFSLAYARVGLSPDCGGSQLVHTLGLHRSLRLALLGDLLTAQEAADAGLVARVVPADQLAAATDEVVATLLAGSPQAFAAAKHLLRDAAEPATETALRKEAQSISALAGTPNGQEGIAAFLEKRAPRFS